MHSIYYMSTSLSIMFPHLEAQLGKALLPSSLQLLTELISLWL